MTIMTPMEGITAPIRPAPAITETFTPEDDTPYIASRRQDGWSAANQRLFLEGIAEGFGIEAACMRVGLSVSSAYAFRRTAKGAAFALGWRAATLLARECVAETLMVRALEGQVDTVVRANGDTVTRHRHDNRLAMSLLARLDRQVERAPDADVQAARLVAQEFDAFLGLVERDEGAARAGLFLARRNDGLSGEGTRDLSPIYALAAADRLVRTGVATAEEIPVADLDPAARAEWTAEQWARAEAAGLIAFVPAPPHSDPAEETPSAVQHIQHSPPKDPAAAAADHIWWDEPTQEWRTDFPPPDGFRGYQEGRVADVDYARELSAAERDLIGPAPEDELEAELAELAALRDAFFAGLAADRLAAADAPVAPFGPPVDRAAISPAMSCTEAGNTAPRSAPPVPPSIGCS